MRRRTFDALMATGGLVLAIILLVAGGLLTWAHSFANDNVHSQLVAQKIVFPPVAGIQAQKNALLPQLTAKEEAKYEAAVDRFIQYDIGKPPGGQGKKALEEFNRVPGEATLDDYASSLAVLPDAVSLG